MASGTVKKLKGGAEEVVSMRIPKYALSVKAKETVAVEVLSMMALAEEEVGANEKEKTRRNTKGTREPVARILVELPLTFHATFSAPALASYDLRSSFYWFHG